jgi:hypothetical protein
MTPLVNRLPVTFIQSYDRFSLKPDETSINRYVRFLGLSSHLGIESGRCEPNSRRSSFKLNGEVNAIFGCTYGTCRTIQISRNQPLKLWQ